MSQPLTFMTPVFFRHNSNIYDISVFSRHDIYIDDISVFFTWHLHSWHRCFSDISATFMTSVLFRHDIYIHDISVFFWLFLLLVYPMLLVSLDCPVLIGPSSCVPYNASVSGLSCFDWPFILCTLWCQCL
jgi:hypothetical protein